MLLNKVLAEFLATFTLASAVLISLHAKLPLSTPVIAGLTLMLFVYLIGGLSGAHLNPAVTIALATVKKISIQDGILYLLSQVLGGILASIAVTAYLGRLNNLPKFANTMQVGIAEAIGAFILVFSICAVAYKKVNESASGIVIGGGLLLGILLSSAVSEGVLNPAVALALGSKAPMYYLGPIIGGFLGAYSYKLLSNN